MCRPAHTGEPSNAGRSYDESTTVNYPENKKGPHGFRGGGGRPSPRETASEHGNMDTSKNGDIGKDLKSDAVTCGNAVASPSVDAHLDNDGNRAKNAKPASRTINIANLTEGELIDMVSQYVTSMNKFACSTRNVHKELKDNLSKAYMLLSQLFKVRKGKKEENSQDKKSASTQTAATKDADVTKGSFTSEREICSAAAENAASPQTGQDMLSRESLKDFKIP